MRLLALSFLFCALLPFCLAADAGPLRPVARPEPPPPMAWDHVPGAQGWTRAALGALRRHGAPLVALVPRDIGQWCPGYPQADRAARRAFWVGLLSALAEHESTWRPRAVGGGGRWHGLVQILPATARGYGCRARSGAALRDGPANLSCALRIMAVTVPRDGVIAEGGRGVAADWGPMLDRGKRARMAAYTRMQDYCLPRRSLRPRARPLNEN
ncbi:MAG: transglycosylase SLT domain-containing protein [Paracoccaceae bacterium]